MRITAALSVLLLLASIPLAWRHYTDRVGVLDTAMLAVADPRERALLGAKNGWLGVAYSGWEQRAEAHPDDLEAVRERIRYGLHIGAVGVGQPGIGDLVKGQTEVYLARRAELDPDGTHLQSFLNDWVNVRLSFPRDSQQGFYTRTSVAIFLAARGDERGAAWLAQLPSEGPAWTQFLPYVRMVHPGWAAVRPLVATYLEDASIAARVEAGYTLLQYNAPRWPRPPRSGARPGSSS
jgi:hypothetical protein